MTKRVYNASNRKFLNRPNNGGDASASFSISVEGDARSEHVWTSGSLTLRDCSRPIHLDLDFATARDMDNSLRKLQIIEELCAEARYRLRQARVAFLDADRRGKLKRKAREAAEKQAEKKAKKKK